MATTTTDHRVWEEEPWDSDEEEHDADETLDSIVKSKTITFSIHANYTNWAPREAFRELVQNWRDGIIKAFRLNTRDFCVVRKEKPSGNDTEIVYKVLRTQPDDDSKEWLGYIRYKGRNGEGTVDITNRSATLQPWHLDLGGTSKAHDDGQAGAHGEGLKLALLVLMRGMQNHGVRCRSGGFNWKFNFSTRGRLVARLNRMSPAAIEKAADQATRLSQRTLLPFGSHPGRDVQFIIGETHRGLDERGAPVCRSPVSQNDFEAWTKAALFLHDAGDGAIISTDAGDLLTGPDLRGRIYLKGLLLSESLPGRSASITSQPLQFGYNFARGYTNRERQSVGSANEEARSILGVWSKALEVKPEVVSELSALLNTIEPKYADIAGAKSNMNFETASRLKTYLGGAQFANKWYYSSEDLAKNPRLEHIIQGLGCEGVQLTDTYWAILRRHGLVRTAEEEEHRRFTTAPPVAATELESAFAQSVHRLLRACLRACPKTSGITIQFVQAGRLHLQLLYSEPEALFRVHERWLSKDSAIEAMGLPADWLLEDVAVHTVKRLFADALEQLPCGVFEDDGSRTAEWGRKLEVSRADQRLLTYLRMGEPEINSGTQYMQFALTWETKHLANESELLFEVQCHSASRCPHRRENLLIAEDASADRLMCTMMNVWDDFEVEAESRPGDLPNSQIATCRSYQYQYYSTGIHFENNLEPGEECFFVVLLPEYPDSFLALSPISPPAKKSVPGPPRKSGPHTDFHIRRSRDPNSGTVKDRDVVLSPGKQDTGTTPPTNVAPVAKQSTAVVPAPAPVTTTAPTGTFTLGPRLSALDVFKLDRHRWYEARNTENVKAVIAILAGEKTLPEESKKRRRKD
ncbi:hypothetical protein B0J18DRAFT_452760 [Chaetomium sp. MPI-SDFR-AT-0129]|nr:hypothetical protein B0J18DRAFT_452760 [Chaetomium sp. MPI-SDFR-AT-0129]